MRAVDTRSPLQLLEDNFRQPQGAPGRLVGRLMAVQHRSLTRWTVQLMGLRPTDRVLDVGCGGGTALGLIAEAAHAGLVVGVDRSPEMVRQAGRRHRGAVRQGRVRVELGDAMDLPEPDGSFDQVCAVETFYFWPDGVRGLREAHRVLRPGGRVTVTVEMSREAGARPHARRSLLQRLLGSRFTDRSAEQGLTILSGPQLCALLVEAGFSEVGYAAEPHRSLGWLCAWGIR